MREKISLRLFGAQLLAMSLVGACCGIGARPVTPTDSQCLSVEIYDYYLIRRVYVVEVRSNGTVTVGYSDGAKTSLVRRKARFQRLCQRIAAAVPDQLESPFINERDAQTKLLEQSYVVVRSPNRSAVAFPTVTDEIDKLVESKLAAALVALDDELRRDLGAKYCLDKRCRETRLDFLRVAE